MISITERLRARQEPVGDGTGTWRPDGLCQEAADTIDALVAAMERLRFLCEIGGDPFEKRNRYILAQFDDALSRAKGKHA